MPFRPRDKFVSSLVTLDETLNWIALDSFDPPDDAVIFDYMDERETSDMAEYSRAKNEELAIKDLFAALRDGYVLASGFLATQFEDVPDDPVGTSVLHSRKYFGHAKERKPISPEFWILEGINWIESIAKSHDREYAGIVLDRQKVLKVWPLPTDDGDADASVPEKAAVQRGQRRPGRPPIYNEREFLALCVCEASLTELPENHSEFIRVMTDLISAIWGEGQTPDLTWFKEKISYIYEQQTGYEKGRQFLLSKVTCRPK